MRTETSARRRRRRQGASLGPPARRPPQAAGLRSGSRCRQRRPAIRLLSWRDAGRPVYVCIAADCLSKVPGLEQAPALRRLARERILQLVGLARRAGQLACGLEATADSLRRAQAAAAEAADSHEGADPGRELPAPVVLACDSLPTKRLAHLPGAHVWPAAEIERAAGLHEAVAVAIRPGRMATQAAYWLRLWYECAPRPRSAGKSNTVAAKWPPNKTATEVG